MNNLIPALMSFIVNNSTLTSAEPPNVAYATDREVAEYACRNTGHCNLIGFYDPYTDKLYMNNKYISQDPDKREQSLLVHELVHYLQERSGRFSRPTTLKELCETKVTRERQAWEIQLRFLRRHNLLLRAPRQNVHNCMKVEVGKYGNSPFPF